MSSNTKMNTIALFVIINNLSIVNGFIVKNQLRQIMITRALTTTLIETTATNVFDQSDIIKNIDCNCEDYSKVIFYLGGIVCFGILVLNNNNTKDDKLNNIEYYKNIKRIIQQIVFIILLLFGKGIEGVL